MTLEDKELLLKDLCARLPYGVWVNRKFKSFKSDTKSVLNGYDIVAINQGEYDFCKPYLFPLSSMTEKQSMELFKLFGISLVDSIGADYIKINECTGITFFLNNGFDVETHLDKLIDWLNKNHFDYRGLISRGLAIDATGKDIY